MPNWKKVIVSGSDAVLGTLIVSGAAAIGTSSLGPFENTLTLGARDSANEGGQIGFNAPGGTYTSASFIDNWQNKHRILKGTNTTSTGLIAQWDIHTTQLNLPAYNNVSAFAGTAVANLAVDSGGNVITVSTTGGSVFPYTGNAVITGSLTVTQPVYIPINGNMYLQGGDDAALYDVNIVNTMGIYGVQDVTVGAVKLGSNGPILYGSGSRIGLGTTTPTSASFQVNGNVWANSFTGSLFGTSSWARNAVTASTVISAGQFGGGDQYFLVSALNPANGPVSPFVSTLVYDSTTNTLPTTASWARSASFASTASYSQNLQISGSINNVNYIDFTTGSIIGTNAPAWKEGRLFYDSGSGALAMYNWEQDVTLNIGQEQWLRARNQTGVTITNGSVVRLLGALGDRPTIGLAQAVDQTNAFSVDNEIIGMATHDIEHGTDGFVTTFGLVNGLNTNAFNAGDILWVSQSAGQFTNIPPPTPFDRTFVGIVTRKNPSNGSVFLTPLTPIHFHDISSVSASAYQQGDLWMYRSGSSGQANAWINTKTLSGSYTISGSLTTRGNTVITGSLITSGSTGNGINTSNTTLQSGPYTTVDWGLGALKDENSITSVDWLNGYTLTAPSYGGVATVEWGSGRLNSLNTSRSINWDDRIAYDQHEMSSVDWRSRVLYDGIGTTSADWTSRALQDNGGNSVFFWDAAGYGESVLASRYYLSLIDTSVQDTFINYAPANTAVNYTGEVIEATLHNSVATNDLVYLDTNGSWYPVTQGTDQCSKLIGICVAAAKSLVLLEGTLTVTSNVSITDSPFVHPLALGRPIYIRDGNGNLMSTTIPFTAGEYVRVLGHAYQQGQTNTDYWIMKFRPSMDWYKL